MDDFKNDDQPNDTIGRTERVYHDVTEEGKGKSTLEDVITKGQNDLKTYFSSLLNGDLNAINDIASFVAQNPITDLEALSIAQYPIFIIEVLPELEDKFNAYIVLSVIASRKYDIYSDIFNESFLEMVFADINASPKVALFAFKTCINIFNSNIEYFRLFGEDFINNLRTNVNLEDPDDPFMLLSSMLFRHTFPNLPIEYWNNIVDLGMEVLYGANTQAMQKVLVAFSKAFTDEAKALDLLNHGVVEHILSFLENENEELSLRAVLCIEALTSTDNEEIIEYLVQIGMIDRLKPFLFHDNPLAVSVCISVLLIIIRVNHAELISQFLEPEIFQKLVETANEGGSVARESISKFFCEAILCTFDPEIWAGIFENGGLEVLIEFMEDGESPILKDVIAALRRVLMKDINFAIALSESNALEILANHSFSDSCSCPEECSQFRKEIKIALREKQHEIDLHI